MLRKRKKKFIIINDAFSKRSYQAKNEKKNLYLITIYLSTFIWGELFQSFSIKSCYTFFLSMRYAPIILLLIFITLNLSLCLSTVAIILLQIKCFK